jgi:hypothetical protein
MTMKTFAEEFEQLGEELNKAIWKAARFWVDERGNKERFVALVTKAASAAWDSQVHNATVRGNKGE